MKFILLFWRWCTAPSHRLLGATLLYYGVAYFVNANIWLLVATLAYIVGLVLITKNVILSLWLALLATLPIAKGKAFPLTLIPKADLITRNAVFDVNYIFSIYISDCVLGLLVWQLIKRVKLWPLSALFSKLTLLSSWQNRGIWWVWAGFLLAVLLPQWHNSLNLIVLLSALQLGKLMLLFGLPSWIGQLKIKTFFDATLQIIMASLLFQTGWSIAQYLNGGPLNRYLEAILPIGVATSSTALSTLENRDILRVTGTFFDPSLLGTYVFTLMAWLWHQLKHQTKQPSWLIWMILILSTLTIILTSNRVLIGLLAIALWLVARQHIQSLATIKRLWRSKVSLSLLAVAVAGLLAVTPYLWTRFQSLNTAFERYGSATYRLQLGWYALRLGSAQPWGVGLNLSPYFLATGFNQETVSFDPSHPHNLFLQLWAETGWLGTLCVMVLIYLIYRPIKTKTGWQWEMSAWGWGGLAFLACAQFYPVFINQIEVASWLALMLGGHLASRRKHLPQS